MALRTLRTLPKVVGKTDDGHTIYDVRGVLLSLPEGGSHFARFVPCARCARLVPGAVALHAADLDRPAPPMYCGDCVKQASRPAPTDPRPMAPDADPGAPPAAAPLPPPKQEKVTGEITVPQALLDRLTSLEATIAEERRAHTAAVGQLAAAQEADRAIAAGTRAEIAQLAASLQRVTAGQEQLTERLDQLPAGLAEGDDVGSALAELVTQVDHLRREVMAAAEVADRALHLAGAGATEASARIDALVESVEAGHSGLHALEQRMQSIATAQGDRRTGSSLNRQVVDVDPNASSLLDSLERQLAAAGRRLTELADAPLVVPLIEPPAEPAELTPYERAATTPAL